MRNLISLFIIGLFTVTASAQLEQVSYSLEFNAEQCMFDVYMNVEKGNTNTTMHRVQLNSQISVIAPANANINVEETFMPLIDNQTKSSNTPASWEVTSMLNAPAVSSHLSYHSITPYLNPAAFYGDIKLGDKVKLFTFSVEPFLNCASDVRLFDNESDPTSLDEGMRGANFKNGFTIGGLHQSYTGNTEKVGPQKPAINVLHKKGREIVKDIEYSAVSSCQGALEFAWMKGDKVIKTGAEAPSLTNSQIRTGQYKLVLTDGLGCSTEEVITIYGDNATAGQTSGLTVDKGNLTSGIDGAEGTVSESHGIADEVETLVNMFPNPAKEHVNIDVVAAIGQTVTANIVNGEGKVVKANIINTEMTSQEQTFRVTIAELNTGLYNVNVSIGGEFSATKKLIIIE